MFLIQYLFLFFGCIIFPSKASSHPYPFSFWKDRMHSFPTQLQANGDTFAEKHTRPVQAENPPHCLPPNDKHLRVWCQGDLSGRPQVISFHGTESWVGDLSPWARENTQHDWIKSGSL